MKCKRHLSMYWIIVIKFSRIIFHAGNSEPPGITNTQPCKEENIYENFDY